jgi:hypothetical protein
LGWRHVHLQRRRRRRRRRCRCAKKKTPNSRVFSIVLEAMGDDDGVAQLAPFQHLVGKRLVPDSQTPGPNVRGHAHAHTRMRMQLRH